MLPRLWERIEQPGREKNTQRRTVALGGVSRSHSAEEILCLKKAELEAMGWAKKGDILHTPEYSVHQPGTMSVLTADLESRYSTYRTLLMQKSSRNIH